MPASSVDNPYVDAQGRTDAELYLMGVLDGSIVAGRKIKQLAEKMLPRIRNGYLGWRYDVDAATRPVEFIERFCMIPSGKLGVPFILEPYERMMIELIFGFVDENEKRQIQYALIVEARKNGKALSLDTEIPTPDGWRLIRDIHPGDCVFGQDGKPSKVLVESEVFNKPMYLVTFEDGATIKSSGDHIWTVCDEHGLSRKDITTEEMHEMLFYGGRYYVPVCRKPIDYRAASTNKSVGSFYDDGFTHSLGFFYPDESERDAIRFAPIAMRTAYISGLVDGARNNGLISPIFDTADFAGFVAEVASSIGLVASIAKSPRLDSWTVAIDEKPSKAIVSICAIPNEPSKCIAIDNDSHLYLAGRQYTATHNTSLGAAIELYLLIADGEGAPQCYNAATSKGQASLAYGAAWRMVRQSPKLSKYLRKGVVTERAETGIISDGNMGYIVPLSKQSDHLDGLDVHFCLLDEMAAAEDRSIFDLVRQGTGAREQPLFIAITTNGFVRDGLFDSEHQYGYDWLDGKIDDDRFLPIFFEQDDRAEVFGGDERMWLKSNPGLMHPDAGHINGGVKSLEYLRSQVLKGKNDSSYMPTLLTKDFNIPANSATAFLSFEEAVNRTPYELTSDFRYCIVGMDAADTLDLNAATAIFMRPGDNHIYRKSMYWIAEEQVTQNNNSMRGRDGGVPYERYAEQGLLRIVPGNYVPRIVFVDWIRELAQNYGLYTRWVGYDPWRMESILPDLRMLVGEQNVEPVRQGARTYSEPLKQLKAYMRDRIIIDGGNSLDHMCNLNAAVKVDSNLNYTVVKKDGPTSRIDGFMALVDAFVCYQRHIEDYKQLIGWYPPEDK